MTLTGGLLAAMMLILAAFQIGLALGMPWGSLAMGGAYPGVYPPEMRIAALVQVAIYAVITLIALTRAGLIWPKAYKLSRMAIWVVVALFILSALANTVTPSETERLIWLPYTLIILGLTVRLAISRPKS